jgi:radical SAM superfamily enzyme
MVIHRITGDGPKDLLIAPLWASRKREVLNMLHHRMKEEQSYQGRLFSH